MRFDAVAFDAHDPAVVAPFWAALLGREVVEEPTGVAATTAFGGRDLHLHLTSTSLEDQQRTVDHALELGGWHVDVGQRPEEGHIVVGDPEGNLMCVIEPGNGFLAGCGRLAEIACDGTRDVGLFWAEALGWPLNWDQDDETSIQSPAGGTRVSWGGPPVEPKKGRNRQRFDLAAGDVTAEVERLVALGAARLDDVDGCVELADPDGNEFRVLAR
jgi:hypothetical protein